MKKHYAVVLENVDNLNPTCSMALNIISYLLRMNYQLPNETRGRRLVDVLHIKRRYTTLKRTVLYALFQLGFSKKQIANLTGLRYGTITYHIANIGSNEITNYIEMEDAIVEIYI